ncbi:MAG: RrF2 family transcriptional regulator [Acidimicrobiales bacterium]
MRLGEGVEWGLHCVTILALLPPSATIPAARLAEFHGVPAAYLAKHLQSLSRAGIVEAVAGAHGGYRLARSADRVTLLEVVEAVEGSAPAFRCTEIRQRGPAAVSPREYRAPCSIAAAMQRAEDAWRTALAAETITDLVADLARHVNPKAALRASRWLGEAMA